MRNQTAILQFHLVHRPLGRAHPGLYHAALQRRPCRARAAEQKIAVADDQLSVRSDVKENADLLLPGKAGGDHAA